MSKFFSFSAPLFTQFQSLLEEAKEYHYSCPIAGERKGRREEHLIRLVFLFLCLLPFTLKAQVGLPEAPPPDSTGKRVKIENADSGEMVRQAEEYQKRLIGNVVLYHKGARMFCDSAVVVKSDVRAFGNIIIEQDSVSIYANSLNYRGESRKATLYDEVVLDDGKQKLFTDQLDYNLKTKIAEYHTGAKLEGEGTNLSSQHGYYHTETKQAYFKGDVVVIDSSFTLQADTLHYDTEKEISYFHGPTNMETDSSKIYCEAGFYNAIEQYGEFEKNVRFDDGKQIATADKIIYDGKKEQTYFEGKVNFEGDNRTVIADDSDYDPDKQISRFRGSVKIADSTQTIYADSLYYYEEEEFTRAWGYVVVESGDQTIWADSLDFDQTSSSGEAWGNVVIKDSIQNIWADYAQYQQGKRSGLAEGKVLLVNHEQEIIIDCERAIFNDSTSYIHATGRPLMRSLIEADTLYLAADTLITFKPDLEKDDRTLIADRNARIFKSDLQAVSDSLIYSTADSVFRFYKIDTHPVVWSDTSQFSADTIFIYQKNEQVDKIDLINKAFIINEMDSTFYNQIKGKDILVRFNDNQVRQMDVKGNGETIYYIRDDAGAYIGVNKTQCSEMLIYFGDNEVDNINFYRQPQATIYPMKQVNHNTLRLENFNWQDKIRPASPYDVRWREKEE